MSLGQTSDFVDAEACYATLLSTLRAIIQPRDHLVGVQSKGSWIAERLHRDLQLVTPLGLISSSLHRDDYTIRGLGKANPTILPFPIDGTPLILVDDVLFTGRTVRAILNELFDFGRPGSIRLAVLVDRGGRQLPIEANYLAYKANLAAGSKISLQKLADGKFEFVVKDKDA